MFRRSESISTLARRNARMTPIHAFLPPKSISAAAYSTLGEVALLWCEESEAQPPQESAMHKRMHKPEMAMAIALINY